MTEVFPSEFLALLVLLTVGGILQFAFILWLISKNRLPTLKLPGSIAAALPALAFVILITTLAVHMWNHFNGWPAWIGEQGFSETLQIHAAITLDLFLYMTYALFTVIPIAALTCTLIKRYRTVLPYLSLYTLSYVGIWLFIACLPKGFQIWWWD